MFVDYPLHKLPNAQKKKDDSYFKKVFTIGVIFCGFSFIYWQLNKLGYLPPISYFLSKNNNLSSWQLSTTRDDLLNYDRAVKDLITLPIDKSQTKILIQKSQYRLTLYYQKQPIKSYPVVFGSNPVGDKFKEGDRKTPEGIFKVRDLYPHAQWSKFIWLDYPNHDSWQKHLQAKKLGKISRFDSIGSEIGIHGVPKNRDSMIDKGLNWTWGCISLKNQDVDELYSVIQVGTAIQINP